MEFVNPYAKIFTKIAKDVHFHLYEVRVRGRFSGEQKVNLLGFQKAYALNPFGISSDFIPSTTFANRLVLLRRGYK